MRAPVDALQAIVLGIVQGLTEFLPISSSGHLRIVPAFFGWEDPGAAFTAVIQLGTMAAVLLYFRKDLWRIAATWLRSLRRPELRGELDARMGWYIIAGTVPISVLGLAFSDQIENEARNLYLIGTTLIVLGLVLYAADRTGRRERDVTAVTLRDSVIIGFAQALALVPGVSRSGATITAGPAARLRPRLGRALLVPALGPRRRPLRASSSCARSARRRAPGSARRILGTIFAFIVGYASIAFLLRWLASHTMASSSSTASRSASWCSRSRAPA